MYRDLMRALADRFHLVAPDYPGFGNSEDTDPDGWAYTFDHLTEHRRHARRPPRAVVLRPVHPGLRRPRRLPARAPPPPGRRLPRRPERQRLRGGIQRRLGSATAHALWHDRTPETEQPLHAFSSNPTASGGSTPRAPATPQRISPDNWNLDLAVLGRPNARRINLDLFYDYRTNPEQYPTWHAVPATSPARDPDRVGRT